MDKAQIDRAHRLHEEEQLRYARTLTMRQKLQWLEETTELALALYEAGQKDRRSKQKRVDSN